VFWAQAVILLALSAFLIVVLAPRRTPTDRTAGRGPDLEQVRGFGYVGAGALALLALGVIVFGLLGRPGYGQAVGMLGLFAFFTYLIAAAVILLRRR
jgi:hypothetical protein